MTEKGEHKMELFEMPALDVTTFLTTNLINTSNAEGGRDDWLTPEY